MQVRCGVAPPTRAQRHTSDADTPPSPDRSASSGTISTGSSMSDHGGTLYRDHLRATSLRRLRGQDAGGEEGTLLYAQFIRPAEGQTSPSRKAAVVLTGECTICCDGQARLSVKGCAHRMCLQCAMHLADPRAVGPPRCPFCRNVLTAFEAVGA